MKNVSSEQKKFRRLELLAEVASMYYEQNMTQAEIADRLFISRSRISRLLKSAHEKGIIHIEIKHYGERSFELEELLKRTYHLKDAYVLNSQDLDYNKILHHMGNFAAHYIDNHIKESQIVGISWGKSIAAAINSLRGFPHPNLEIVQVIGGTLVQNPFIDISGLTQKIVERYQATGFYLNAPLYMQDGESAKNLKLQPVIKFTLDKAKNADMIITGIGAVGTETFAYMWTGYDNQAELQQLIDCGAVGFICAQAFDIQGKPVCTGFNERVVGIALEELKDVKTVVGISGGKRKAAAVLGALRAKYCNVLVTDRSCVTEILRLERETVL